MSAELRPEWQKQLDSVSVLTPGWFDYVNYSFANGHSKSRWGEPPDEGALRTTERFLLRLGAAALVHVPSVDCDPTDGSIYLWWHANGGEDTLTVYLEAGLVSMVLGATPKQQMFSPNLDDVPFDVAVDEVLKWLAEYKDE